MEWGAVLLNERPSFVVNEQKSSFGRTAQMILSSYSEAVLWSEWAQGKVRGRMLPHTKRLFMWYMSVKEVSV
jgi:hypothetical protein